MNANKEPLRRRRRPLQEDLDASSPLDTFEDVSQEYNAEASIVKNHNSNTAIQELEDALFIAQNENRELHKEYEALKKKYHNTESSLYSLENQLVRTQEELDGIKKRFQKQKFSSLIYKIIIILIIIILSSLIFLYCSNGWIDTGVKGFIHGAIFKNNAPISVTTTFSPTPTITPVPTSTQKKTSLPTIAPTETPLLIGLAKEAEKNTSGQSLDKQLNEFQKQLNDTGASIRAKKDTNKYSYSEEEVWQYCMDRWAYYDKLAGGYAGDKYTKQVFKDAGSKFGISASEAERIWDKVDRSKYGLD